MYSDKEKQKQANKARQQRYRDKNKGSAESGVSKQINNAQDDVGLNNSVTPDRNALENITPITPNKHNALPENFGLPNCACLHCKQNKEPKVILNHGAYKPASELKPNEYNRVSLPGDVDYDGVCNDSKYDSHRIKQTV